jgi:hypothetical protein
MQINITPNDLSKVRLDEIALSFIEPVLDGEVPAIQQWSLIKAINEVTDRCLKDEELKKVTLNEVDKWGKQGATFNGAKIEIANTSKLDWGNVSDPVYKDLKAKEEALKEQIKERETFLKGIPYAGIEVTNEETGEVCRVFAPTKLTSTSPKVTFAK